MMATLVLTLLANALDYAVQTHSVNDVLGMIERGEAQLWEAAHSVIVTQVHVTPRKKSLNLFLAAGRMNELKDLWPKVRAWAREMGCESAYLVGRAGWARSWLTKDDGWRITNLVLETNLSGGEKLDMT